MAVCKMSLISIIGPVKKLDELVNVCGESGVFQPDNISSFYSNTENFIQVAEENPFATPLAKLTNAIYSCGAKVEDTDIKNFQVSRSKIDKYVNYFSGKIEGIMDKKREIHNELASLNEEVQKLEHFYKLTKPLKELLSCEYIKPRFGKIPINEFSSFEKITEDSRKRGIDLLFFELDTTSEFVWGVYFAKAEDLKEVDIIFSKMQFQEIELKAYEKPPLEQSNILKHQIKELYYNLEVLEKEIKEFWESEKNNCMKFYKKIKKLSTYFEIKYYAAKYNSSFILVGWVPDENIQSLKKSIEGISGLECSIDESSGLLNHSPPVKLKNKKLFQPFEFFVETYGMPSYNEVDPTTFVAITFSLLFGIMFADLGQGLVLALSGWIASKFKNIDFGKILIPCGISSAIFGTLFGSVFGFEHALDPLYSRLFGLKEKPIEVMSPAWLNRIVYASIGLGVVLLIVSMIIGIYSMVRRGSISEAIFSSNGVAGLVFYVSLIYMLMDMMILHTGVVGAVYIIIFLVLPLLLIMFKEILIDFFEKKPNWQPESWTDYVVQSFFELFEVILSYFTNTMSFLRVGVFVLVHVGMMMLVFTIADMLGGIGYILAVIIGNIFVIGFEGLLSGIQVLRLEFYEMFSKFFEGQGRTFSPVGVDEIKE